VAIDLTRVKSSVTKFGTKRLTIGNINISINPLTSTNEISVIVTQKHDGGFTVLHDEVCKVDIEENHFVCGFIVNDTEDNNGSD